MSLIGYAPAKPHFELLEVLAAIAAYQDSKFEPGKGKRWGRAAAWCIVRQVVIRGWYHRLFKRYERPAGLMCRRTLQYHLAALRNLGHLRIVTRHEGEPRTNKLELRPSLYEFTARGRQWISRRAGWVENPRALVAAQKIAQSGLNFDPYSSTSLSSAVDKSPTAGKNQHPRQTAAMRARSSSTSDSEPRGLKALVRKEAAGATKAPGARKPNGKGHATTAQPRRC